MIGDFGLAIRLDPSTNSAPMEGTPVTMAPEMRDAGFGGIEADIYSMGVSLYRLLSGEWPIWATTKASFKPLVLKGSVRPFRDVAPHVSRRLASRVNKALALDPLDRFHFWREMHEALGVVHVVERTWDPIAPFQSHVNCWEEASATRSTRFTVCVSASDSGIAIDTRRATPARTRVARHCHKGLTAQQSIVKLRRIFDDL
jgi:serine/threonine protein kinase